MANTALHPGGNPGANLESISYRCYLREVAFEWELTKAPIYLPPGCLQGGCEASLVAARIVAVGGQGRKVSEEGEGRSIRGAVV